MTSKGNGKGNSGKTGKGKQTADEQPAAAQQMPRFFLVRDDAVYGVKCLATSDPDRLADLTTNHGWRQVSAEEWAQAQTTMHATARKVIASQGA